MPADIYDTKFFNRLILHGATTKILIKDIAVPNIILYNSPNIFICF